MHSESCSDRDGRLPAVTISADLLEKVHAALIDALNQLFERLDPVLRPEPPATTTASDSVGEAQCQLAQRLINQITLIENQCLRLKSVLERLEI
jgi:hypothetical protein